MRRIKVWKMRVRRVTFPEKRGSGLIALQLPKTEVLVMKSRRAYLRQGSGFMSGHHVRA